MILRKKAISASGDTKNAFVRAQALSLKQHPDEPVVEKLQGSFDARYVVLTPPPDLSRDDGVFWADASAVAFVNQLKATCSKLNHNKDLLCVPCTFIAAPGGRKKTKKQATEPTLKLCEALAEQGKVFLTFPKPFALLFRDGSSSDTDMLCGHWLYPKELDGAPLLVFPDPAPLTLSDDQDSYDNFREFKKAQARRLVTLRHYQYVNNVFAAHFNGGKFIARQTELETYEQ